MHLLTTLATRSPASRAGRARIGAALLTALLGAGCGEPPVPTCPAGEPIQVDLEAWREAVVATVRSEAFGAPAERDRLLGQLALAPVPAEVGAASGGGAGLSGPTSFELFPVRRGGGEPDDQLVAVRFREASGAELLRVQLLRPLAAGDDLYCALGDDLSRDTEAFEEPCLEPHDGPARELVAEPLLGPDRHAVVVRDAGGWCGPGTSRGDRFATSWWGVEDGRLVRYLEAVTHEAWYEAPAPPSEIRRAEITLSTGWPRAITVRETVECRPEAGADCRPVGRTTEHRYEDGRYVAGAEAPAAESSETTEETTP